MHRFDGQKVEEARGQTLEKRKKRTRLRNTKRFTEQTDQTKKTTLRGLKNEKFI